MKLSGLLAGAEGLRRWAALQRILANRSPTGKGFGRAQVTGQGAGSPGDAARVNSVTAENDEALARRASSLRNAADQSAASLALSSFLMRTGARFLATGAAAISGAAAGSDAGAVAASSSLMTRV